STRSMSITGRVPPVQDQLVPVRIFEERQVADAGISRLALEGDTLGLELRARSGYVPDADGNPGRAPCERSADARWIEDVKRHLAEGELQVVLALRLDRKPKRSAVEAFRPREVLRQHRDEVDLLDDKVDMLGVDHCGAYRLCSINAFPSGSRNNDM